MKNLLHSKGFMSKMSPSATMSISAKAKAMKKEGKDVCVMSAGEPDFDTPDHIKSAAVKALEGGATKYTPAAGIPELRDAVAEKFRDDNGISTESSRIVVSPGAKFSVFASIAALCGPGDEVILPTPYWVSYPEMVKASGAEAVVVPCRSEDNFELDIDLLASKLSDKTKLLVLNTPGNPSGAVYSRKKLQEIADLALDKNFMILSDEIYEKLTYNKDLPHISIASLSDEINEHTITVNGFSKAYAMTGWRLGYLSAPEWLVKRISALQSHSTSNPTTFSQYGGLEALTGNQDVVETMRSAFDERRELIYSFAEGIPGVSAVYPSGAFYLFCDISSFGLSSQEFCMKFLDEKLVAAIPGAPFGSEGFIRMSYACSDESIREAMSRLREFCSGL